MHNLALALHQLGNQVTGSDDQIFEPSRTRLENAGILPNEMGWFPGKLDANPDAVILGMHARGDNPELIRANELGIKVYSFPEFLYEHSKDKTRIVIAGSHGKTTITSMLMHVLRESGMKFDYMVGSLVEGFDTMVSLTDAPIVVLEGDEYLTSPLDPRPKFLWYKPHIALISGIAWDHINVFPTYEMYVNQFRQFTNTMTDSGYLVYDKNDSDLATLMQEQFATKREGYGPHPYKIVDGQTVLLTSIGEIAIEVFGEHNLTNLNGALLICKQLGMTEEVFYRAIATFKGAARRLEKWEDSGNRKVFRDFAHSPSKLKATVAAVKAQYPDRKVVAVMELFTYSSLNKAFLPHYANSMKPADIGIVYYNPEALKLKRLESFSDEDVKSGFNQSSLEVYSDSQALESRLKEIDYSNSVLLLMSSGNFNNLDLKSL